MLNEISEMCDWTVNLMQAMLKFGKNCEITPSLEDVFDKTMNKMILDEILEKFNKFKWQETFANTYNNKVYTAPINVNGAECIIVIETDTANLAITHHTESIIYDSDIDNFDKRKELLDKVKPLIASVNAKEILNTLREL